MFNIITLPENLGLDTSLIFLYKLTKRSSRYAKTELLVMAERICLLSNIILVELY